MSTLKIEVMIDNLVGYVDVYEGEKTPGTKMVRHGFTLGFDSVDEVINQAKNNYHTLKQDGKLI